MKTSPHKSDLQFNNKVHNEINIAQRKSILNSKPRFITATLTSRCTLACIMCEVWKYWKGKTPWEMPDQTMQEIVKLFPYLEGITWSGGEAFLYKDFQKFFDKAAKYPKLKQEITTNALTIDQEWAKRLTQSNLTLVCSVDAFNSRLYEQIRSGARFRDLLKSLDVLNRHRNVDQGSMPAGFNLVLNFVVMKSNLHEIKNTVDFAAKYGFNEIRFVELKFLENEENIFIHRNQQALKYIREVMPEVFRRAKERKILVHDWFLNPGRYIDHDSGGLKIEQGQDSLQVKEAQDNPGIENIQDCLAAKEKVKKPFCLLPWKELFINAGGAVTMQCFCDREIGNVCGESLDEIWNGKKLQELREKVLRQENFSICNPQCICGAVSKELLGGSGKYL